MTFHDYDIEQVVQAKAIIDADISRHHSIEALAVQVAMGKTKLKEAFRVYYGKGVYTYLREIRMAKALELVNDSSQTFKQIAKACGYKYYNNFITAFSNYHGITPLHARREARQ